VSIVLQRTSPWSFVVYAVCFDDDEECFAEVLQMAGNTSLIKEQIE